MTVVLCGLTGSGKTELLHRLDAGGEQILDLEKLAGHRGSAFGNLGGATQPHHDVFQAAVRGVIDLAAPDRPLWIEDEGDYIGSVGLPPELVATLRRAPCVEVAEETSEARVARIMREYGRYARTDWDRAVIRIAARLGTERTALVRAALRSADLAVAIRVLLAYYDSGYRHRIAAFGRRVLGTVGPRDVDGAIALVGAVASSRLARRPA